VVYLGDWVWNFSYAVFDSDGLRLEMYEEWGLCPNKVESRKWKVESRKLLTFG
jgi:hypothetical protein